MPDAVRTHNINEGYKNCVRVRTLIMIIAE